MHPAIEPFASGLLAVGGDVEIYWETSGNPHGRPALYLHGGPGSGLGPGGYRRRYDPERYLIVGIDQRGCGRSRPLVTEALDALKLNTTKALIDDIEAVREHLGIDRWLVSGVSWGTTLALAYALTHPQRVTELVLVAVAATSRREIDWLTEDMQRVFPEAWERFAADSGRVAGERIVSAYARRLTQGDQVDRARAADAWDAWEAAHMRRPAPLFEDPIMRAVYATLVTHYWSHDGFLAGDAAILNRTAELKDIPTVLIHGRIDVSGPAITAWQLHEAIPGSRLVIVEEEGHGGPTMMEHMSAEIDAFGS
ncbi:MAG: prolyl aminopeptidase [Actinomycetota bacterium]|nr:prolyl aminopeptidase [Actinomycetota bacterium]